MGPFTTLLVAAVLFTGTVAAGLGLIRWWEGLPVGTRSVLFGVHAWWLHPFFVAWGWTKVHGFPWDPRLWVAFAVHDLGYIGKPNMDGEEGETHPEWAARIMFRWFDHHQEGGWRKMSEEGGVLVRGGRELTLPPAGELQVRVAMLLNRWFGQERPLYWHDLVLYHSRFYARQHTRQPSPLCYADKLAICLTPWWLYLPMAEVSGELVEYMRPDLHENGGKYEREGHEIHRSPREWYVSVQDYLRGWIGERV